MPTDATFEPAIIAIALILLLGLGSVRWVRLPHDQLSFLRRLFVDRRRKFIIADGLSKVEMGGSAVGYRGVVTWMTRGATKVMLHNASVYRFIPSEEGDIRQETGETLDCIALSSEQWNNVSFIYYKVIDSEQAGPGKASAA